MKNFKLVSATALGLAACSAHAQFFDDFESGLGQWQPGSSAYITTDPYDAGNHVLAFSALRGGGDIFSNPLSVTPWATYQISCDYLGLGSTDGGVGGYLGVGLKSLSTTWIFGDPVPPVKVQLISDGQWHHYTSTFYSKTPLIDLVAEQFKYDHGTPGTVFFDNIKVNAVPEPCSMIALGLGAAALLRRKRA